MERENSEGAVFIDDEQDNEPELEGETEKAENEVRDENRSNNSSTSISVNVPDGESQNVEILGSPDNENQEGLSADDARSTVAEDEEVEQEVTHEQVRNDEHVIVTNASTDTGDEEGDLYCPGCGEEVSVDEKPLRKGDACPSCRAEYLEER